MANSVDSDQMPHYVASDLGLHCFLKLSGSVLRVNMVVHAYRLFSVLNIDCCNMSRSF